MGSDLSVLIRLHKHQLDEKRVALGQVQMQLAVLIREMEALEAAFLAEKKAADNSSEVSFTFPKYADEVKKKRAQLDSRRAGLEQQIEAAKDSMMETFSELKKYEMTQAERDRLEQEEQRVREGKMMDDIGLESFRRKSEDL